MVTVSGNAPEAGRSIWYRFNAVDDTDTFDYQIGMWTAEAKVDDDALQFRRSSRIEIRRDRMMRIRPMGPRGRNGQHNRHADSENDPSSSTRHQRFPVAMDYSCYLSDEAR